MSSITELEFIQLLHQTRIRFDKTNQQFSISPQMIDDDDSSTLDVDEGLVMKLDSQISPSSPISVPVKIINQSETTTSVRPLRLPNSSIADFLIKKIHQVVEEIQKEAIRLLPLLLYLSLLVLGFQGIGIFFLFLSCESFPIGLLFLIGCGFGLGFLYYVTSSIGLTINTTPTPTPSHSSQSLQNID